MKIKSSIFYSVMFLGLLGFASCKKEETPKPDPKGPEVQLFEKAQGKWRINVPAGRIKNPPVSSKAAPLSSKIQGSSSFIVEFLSDNSFIFGYGFSGTLGTYEVKNNKAIELKDLAELSDISFSDNTMSFTFTWFGEDGDEDEVMNVTATKFADIEIPQNRKDILKKWYIELTGDIADEIEDMGYEIDRIERTYTVNGTVLTEGFKDDELLYTTIMHWHMHATEDAIVEYSNQASESTPYFKLETFSASAVVLGRFEQNDDGEFEKTGTYKYFSEKPAPADRKR